MKKIISLLLLFVAITLLGQELDKLSQANKFRQQGKYENELQELDKLLINDKDNVEILWRIAQAHFDIADQSEDKDVQKKHFYSGFKSAEKAVKIDPNNARANHWYATLIGKIGMLEGNKQKIKNSYKVKEYALKSLEIDPNYDGSNHLLGRWHYEIASLSWPERKIASLIYSKPPNGSFERAISYFKKAAKLKPDEIRHQFWLGKTYLKTKEKEKAREAFRKVSTMKAFDNSDIIMKKEAAKLLKKLN